MPTGSCFCGECKIEYTGEPVKKALCHCLDCRKIGGGTSSINIIVPGDTFKVTGGKPKSISKKADSGNDITSHFCGDCGTTLYRDGATFEGLKIIKAGVLDDEKVLADAKPTVELFAPERVEWVAQIQGAEQKDTMS